LGADHPIPVPIATAPGGSSVVIEVPRDESSRPWQLHVDAEQPVCACR
jgi:hypothetical protein